MKETVFQLSEVERQKLIEQYQAYVHKLAHQTSKKLSGYFDFEDIVAYGMIGLVEAAERYNPQRGVTFITFAHYRIKGAIFDGLRQMGLPARVISRQTANFEHTANVLLQAAADDETGDAAVQNVNDEVRKIEHLIDNLIPAYLLSLDSEEALNAPDNSLASAQEEIEKYEVIQIVRQIVEDLPEQEREMIEAMYYKHRSMTDFAAQKGITKSWVSRLHTRVVHHIRDKLKEIGFVVSDEAQ